ncbi:MAG: 2-oxoacid:acceptor oxidoreductase family protein [Clostridiales bacterium]|jgi:2-oxoglutarate ferredoxin oxidoreductase subunit gamma|nr:2-oxoacid:acceptor oxidoreductase family protein [Clostridiales bacterium]
MGDAVILVAGFGGQGILFAGKFLVYAGMLQGKHVSWLPSYGPEMRGGTANCSVIISDRPIGSPIAETPNILVVMNTPSLDAFEKSCVSGGRIFVDSSLIERKIVRDDVTGFYIPATRLADEDKLKGLANMIMVGKIIRETGICDSDEMEAALNKIVPERKKNMLEANLRAINLGYISA